MIFKSLTSLALAVLLSLFISGSIQFFTSTSFAQWTYIPLFFLLFFFAYNLLYSFRVNKDDFTQFLLFSLALKLLLAFFILLICAFFFRTNFAAFAVHFVSTYLIFTVFEIRFLNQLIQSHSTKTKPSHHP